jgi:hypothetical protein
MRYYYLFAAIAVSFLTGTWLGYTLSEQRQTDAAPGYTLATPQPYTQTDMDVLHSELRAMKATLDQLSTSIHTNTTSSTSSGESNTVDKISRANYAPNEIAGFQNNIYAQISDPSFNLSKLHAMPEFQKLSEQDKKPVLDEIAKRLDSGEISKRTFLPGYNPASEKLTTK